MMLTWWGIERRIEQRAYDGPERRRWTTRDHRPENETYDGAPAPPPNGRPGDGPMSGWLRQWVAPQTLIALVAFAGLTSVAHYRLEQVEREVAVIRADMAREVAAMRADITAYYARRDVLTEQLKTIDMRLSGIERSLRTNGRGGSRVP